MSNKGFAFRLIGVLLLLGLIAAGGFIAYKTGEVQGISQAPAVATAISEAAENGQAVPPMMYGRGYGYGYPDPYGFGYRYHFGFFPFGICGSILFIFLLFGLLRMVFFRPWHRGHIHGPWGRHWEDGVPPMFNDWHKRAHGEAAPSDSESPKTEA